MDASEVPRAIAAAKAVASRSGLPADEAGVVQDSNRLTLYLLPCDVLARVAGARHDVAHFEVGVAQKLAQVEGCPVAGLDPRVEPAVHEEDGFAVTLWAYHGPQTEGEVLPDAYAQALEALHAGMHRVSLSSPHFTDRVAEAHGLVSDPSRTPALAGADRALLEETLVRLQQAVLSRGAPEQLLHGEPHPGNVLATRSGPLFTDLETCCHGPIEFDLAHAPREVSARYPGAEPSLLGDCRGLTLAMVAAWRWDRDDDYPDGRSEGRRFLRILRAGPPWPALGE